MDVPEISDVEARRILRAMEWSTTHQPVYMAGVSEEALHNIGAFLQEAQGADPGVFEREPRGVGRFHRGLRLLPALFPETVPEWELPERVRDLVANPGLSLSDVCRLLEGLILESGRVLEHAAPTVWRAGVLVRSGASLQRTARELGVGTRLVWDVTKFLGVARARRDALRERAMWFLEEHDLSDAQLFADQVGLTYRTARSLLRDVGSALREDVAA